MEPFGLKLITAPAVEPVTLAEVKARLGVTGSDANDDITLMGQEARALAEEECGRAFVTQTWSLFLDGFPAGREILIPRPPLQTVTWVKYYDADGTQQTFSSANYHVAVGREPGRVVLAAEAAWPAVQAGRPESVEVRFVAGYGLAAAVPYNAKAAVLVIAAERFENPGGAVAIPPAARRLLNSLEVGQVW